jgi:hypothetical protein
MASTRQSHGDLIQFDSNCGTACRSRAQSPTPKRRPEVVNLGSWLDQAEELIAARDCVREHAHIADDGWRISKRDPVR